MHPFHAGMLLRCKELQLSDTETEELVKVASVFVPALRQEKRGAFDANPWSKPPSLSVGAAALAKGSAPQPIMPPKPSVQPVMPTAMAKPAPTAVAPAAPPVVTPNAASASGPAASGPDLGSMERMQEPKQPLSMGAFPSPAGAAAGLLGLSARAAGSIPGAARAVGGAAKAVGGALGRIPGAKTFAGGVVGGAGMQAGSNYIGSGQSQDAAPQPQTAEPGTQPTAQPAGQPAGQPAAQSPTQPQSPTAEESFKALPDNHPEKMKAGAEVAVDAAKKTVADVGGGDPKKAMAVASQPLAKQTPEAQQRIAADPEVQSTVNDAVQKGQAPDFLTGLHDFWSGLDPTQKFFLIGGLGLGTVGLLHGMANGSIISSVMGLLGLGAGAIGSGLAGQFGGPKDFTEVGQQLGAMGQQLGEQFGLIQPNAASPNAAAPGTEPPAAAAPGLPAPTAPATAGAQPTAAPAAPAPTGQPRGAPGAKLTPQQQLDQNNQTAAGLAKKFPKLQRFANAGTERGSIPNQFDMADVKPVVTGWLSGGQGAITTPELQQVISSLPRPALEQFKKQLWGASAIYDKERVAAINGMIDSAMRKPTAVP